MIDGPVVAEYHLDTDGDGQNELVTDVTTSAQDRYVILSDDSAAPLVIGPLWASHLGEAGIASAKAGTLTILMGCDTCGRSGHRREWHIVFREGAYLLAGLTEIQWDRLFAESASCDANLLSGRADISRDPDLTGARVKIAEAAPPLAGLPVTFQPAACRELMDGFWAAR
ncbi:hypothetical protein [Thioclava kandeliae]|uniref:Uncharacterized protein n=1 Tax=Thioclava kandeliae TaxID=3070818 RepID=A0ABV1SKF4_9RHOB